MSQKKWAHVSEHQKTTNKKIFIWLRKLLFCQPRLKVQSWINAVNIQQLIQQKLLINPFNVQFFPSWCTFKKLCWSSHTVPRGEGRGHLALNTEAIFHVHFQVVQSWKIWLKYFEWIMYCIFLVKTVAQYTNKYFQKSLIGVIIQREEVEKDIALNTAALFPPWRRLKTSTITMVSIPWTLSVAYTEGRTTVSLCS